MTQGSQLQRLVEVMDQLRSPGGCPWDAEQTHESLLKYLLEESYEFVDAVAAGNRVDMREELGDVLLQVYFHARMAEDHPTDPFSIEDVAKGIADNGCDRSQPAPGNCPGDGEENRWARGKNDQDCGY